MAAAFADRDISLLSTYLYRSPTSLNGLFGQSASGEFSHSLSLSSLSLSRFRFIFPETYTWIVEYYITRVATSLAEHRSQTSGSGGGEASSSAAAGSSARGETARRPPAAPRVDDAGHAMTEPLIVPKLRAPGKVIDTVLPSTCLEWALQHCERWLHLRDNEDIDWPDPNVRLALGTTTHSSPLLSSCPPLLLFLLFLFELISNPLCRQIC